MEETPIEHDPASGEGTGVAPAVPVDASDVPGDPVASGTDSDDLVDADSALDLGPDAAEPVTSRRFRGAAKVAREWALVIAAAVALAFVVRTFVAQTFYIPSGSMETTLQIGDRILVNKLAYDFHPIHRGDVIVFARPAAEDCAGPPVPDLVKRVIGLPGETISSRGNDVLIDGKVLHEPWLPAIGRQLGTTSITPTYIRAGQLFVMGDNRPDSCDSRMWGTVPKTSVVGEVQFIIWPPAHWGFPG